MRKFLSLMLAMALIITTLALPVSVSADSITPSSETITLSYTTSLPDGTIDVHPGDTFNLTVKATAKSNAVSIDGYTINIDYNSDVYEIVAGAGYSVMTRKDTGKKYIRIYKAESSSNATTITTDGTVIVENIPVTVKYNSSVADSTTTEFKSLTSPYASKFTVADEASATTGSIFADSTTSYTYKLNTATIDVDGKGFTSGSLYTKEGGVLFTVTGTNIESVSYLKTGATNATNVDVADNKTAAATITEDGEYTVTVKFATGEADKTFTFRVATTVIKAVIGLDNFSHNDGGYLNDGNAKVSVPVKISEIGDNKTGMVSFDLAYDTNVLTLDENVNTNVKYTDKTEGGVVKSVAYGTDETGASLTNDADFLTLTFSVKENAAIGATDITISNQQITLKEDGVITYDNTESTISVAKVSAVIVPEKFATITGLTDKSWKNSTPYNIEVVPADANKVTYKWVKVTDGTTYDDQAAMKALFDGITDESATNKAVSVTEDGVNYIVVAAIGNDSQKVYQIVGTLVPGTDIFYDKTKPVIDDTSFGDLSMNDYAKTKEIDVNFASDKVGEKTIDGTLDSVEYIIVDIGAAVPTGADTEQWTAVADAKITIAESKAGDMYFRAKDKAGNVSDIIGKITIKVDGVAPKTLTAVAQTETHNGIPIVINAEDEQSNIKVKVYYSVSAIDNPTADSFKDLVAVDTQTPNAKTYTGEYTAEKDGFYYVLAEDEAGNVTIANAVEVTLTTIQEPSDISVKVGADLTYKNMAFYNNEESENSKIKDFDYSNGTFAYVAIKVNAANAGYTNEVTATKNDTDFTLTAADDSAADKEYVFNDAGTYIVTVKTTHTNSGKSAQRSYKFTIAANQEEMVSPSSDNEYDIFDFTMIKKVVNASETLNGIPTAAYGFSGIYAGDLNGDFTTNETDLQDIINSIKDGEIPGWYSFAIMNGNCASK